MLPRFLMISALLTSLLASGCIKRFIDPNQVCDPTELGLSEINSSRLDAGGFNDTIPWTFSIDKEVLTLEWDGLCGDECTVTEFLEIDLSDNECLTLLRHYRKEKDYYDGRATVDLGTSDFQWQHWVPDSLVAGKSNKALFWIEL
jgi:hypothetical protein